MAQRLNHCPGWAAGRNQVLGRGMAEIHNAFAQHDAPGGAIGKPGALGGNLGRKAKRVRSSGTVDLQVRSGFPGESLCHIVRRGGQSTQFGVQLRKIVKTAGKPPQLSGLRQPGQGLVDGSAGGNVEKIARCEDAAASVCTGTLHDPIGNRGG